MELEEHDRVKMELDGELVKQAWLVIVTLAGTLAGGLGLRRVLSKDARDRAKNESEEDYFATALNETKLDRDNWRRTAEQAWERLSDRDRRITQLEHDLRNEQLARVMQRKIVIRRCPEALQYLPSEPGDFDDAPVL